MMLYKNTQVKVRSPDGDTDVFDIIAGVQQRDTLAPYLFIICLVYVLRTLLDLMKENGFTLATADTAASCLCQSKAIFTTDPDYADDITLLENTPTKAEFLLHNIERGAGGICRYLNADKTEFMCFNPRGDISTQNGGSPKLVNKFTHDINTRLAKAWTANYRLSIIRKSGLTDKIKCSFFQTVVVSILLYRCTTWTLTKHMEKKLDGSYVKMLLAVLDKSWRQHLTKQKLYGHLPPILKTIQIRRTRYAGDCWISKEELISDTLPWRPSHGSALYWYWV